MKLAANPALAAAGLLILAVAFVPQHRDSDAVTAGYTELWSGRASGVDPLLGALARDPASPFRWSDVAEAAFESGDIRTARYCRDRALLLGPNVPAILLRAANLSWLLGDTASAVSASRKTLGITRAYDDLIFENFRRFGVPVKAEN